MKPMEKKPETVFRIIDRQTGEAQGSYSRACCDEFDFDSPDRARTANCHGIFRDREKYRIAKYRVVYELLDDDVHCQSEEDPKPPPDDNLLVVFFDSVAKKAKGL